MSDAIEHPSHYNQHPSGLECITVTQHFNFNVGNAIKYLWRAGIKDPSKHLEDLQKALKYVQFEIERVSAKQAKAPMGDPQLARQAAEDEAT